MSNIGLFSGILVLFTVIFIILGLLCYIIYAIGAWKVFEKAGQSGWKAIIPIYNSYIFYKISWSINFFWIFIAAGLLSSILRDSDNFLFAALATITSIITLVLTFIQNQKLALAFNKGLGFTLGLFFLNPIFMLILGFGSSDYIGNQS